MNTMWKGSLKELQDLRRVYNKLEPIMTQVERMTAAEQIKNKTEASFGIIVRGALDEYNGAITSYQAATGNVDKAKAAELRRWDSGKLVTERQNLRQQIDMALEAGKNPFTLEGPDNKINKFLEEAKQSGDAIRVRSAAEVGRVVMSKAPDIAPLVGELESLTAASRRTAEMAAAEQERQAALNNLITLRDGLPEIGAAIGEPTADIFDPGSLARAMRKVRLNQDGSAEILPDDHPDVCGFAILPDKTETAGGGL